MEDKKYNLEYFIDKFSKIPEKEWGVGSFLNKKTGCKCAYGHCGVVDFVGETLEGGALIDLEIDVLPIGFSITQVNDGLNPDVLKFGKTPKERIVNYLKQFAGK